MNTNAVLDQLREERDSARDAAIALASSDDFDPAAESYTALETRAASLDTQIERLVGLMSARDAADSLDGKLAKNQRRSAEERNAPQTREHWADTFIRSDEFRLYTGRGTTSKVEIDLLTESFFQARALPYTLVSMGDALPPVPVYDLTPAPLPPSILPLVNTVSVSQNSVDYITWAKKAGAAAVVPEGTLKPSIEWEPSVSSKTLVTIADHTSFSRQLAQDAPAVRSFLTGELQNEVRRKIEEEAQAAVAAATFGSVTGSDLLAALRKGIAAVQKNGFTPNGFTVSADDLAEMDIAVMSATVGGPVKTGNYWGLTPVIDWTKDAGDPIHVGDFGRGINHYSRTGVELFLTDSHAANFTLNILDAIAEARCLTVVTRPDAIVTATAA